MKVTVIRENKRALVIQGEQVALKAPKLEEPLMIEAEFEEGSPVHIIVNGSEPMPIRRLAIVNRKTYQVAAFYRTTKAGTVKVDAHERKMPYRKLRTKHQSI